jgi:hypothetical protein
MRRAHAAPLALAFAVLLAPLWARAGEVVSAGPDRVAVTIYRGRPVSTWRLTHHPAGRAAGGLALITETRTIDLPAGPAVIRFEGVSDQIVPQTAGVEGLPAKALERNFDYDLLTPGSLIAKSLGQAVELVDTNPKTGKVTSRRAVLRSGPDGVVLDVGGNVEAFQCDRVPQRLVFERIPEGLSDRPTLSLKTDAAKPGHYTVRLSYLATGFNWSADYVARVRPDGKTLDLEGWITLANATAESFNDAPTQVVAGRLALTGEDRAVNVEPLLRAADCWERNPPWSRPPRLPLPAPAPPAPLMLHQPPMAMMVKEAIVTGSRARMARQEDLGDYKLYTLPEPTTVAAQQSKQVLFLARAAVPFRRVYRYRVDPGGHDDRPKAPEIVLKLDNSAAGGLGLPLPAGTVSVREPAADGGLVFTGETRVEDTPKGLPVKLQIGRAATVSVTQKVVEADGRRVRYEVSAVNPLPVPATVEIVHPAVGRDFRVVASSRPHGSDAGDPAWTLVVPPGGREVLTYTVQTGR